MSFDWSISKIGASSTADLDLRDQQVNEAWQKLMVGENQQLNITWRGVARRKIS